MSNKSKSKLRTFGLGLTIITGIIGTIFFFKEKNIANYIFWTISGYSLIVSVFFPIMILPFHWVMTWIGKIMGWINTRIILILLFFLIVTPINLILSVFKKDRLNLKSDKNKTSYWLAQNSVPLKDGYQRQF